MFRQHRTSGTLANGLIRLVPTDRVRWRFDSSHVDPPRRETLEERTYLTSMFVLVFMPGGVQDHLIIYTRQNAWASLREDLGVCCTTVTF